MGVTPQTESWVGNVMDGGVVKARVGLQQACIRAPLSLQTKVARRTDSFACIVQAPHFSLRGVFHT